MKADLKNRFGITPKEFAEKHFENFNIKSGEIEVEYCPFCNGGKNDDKKTFYIDLDNGAFVCHRASCGKKGSFYELLKEFNEVHPDEMSTLERAMEETFKKPDLSETTNLNPEIVNWFKWQRDISEETLEEWDVREKDGNIAFPFKDRDGEEVLLKIRTMESGSEKSVWQEGGGKPILWNFNKLDPEKPVIISEGEIDCLALSEAGVDNVTSIPFGARKYRWVDNCWDFLEKCQHIILWLDNDSPGKQTEKELVKRLGAWRCSTVKSDYKDPNEHLTNEGPASLRETVEDAEDLAGGNLSDLSTIKAFDLDERIRVPSSLEEINNWIGGYPGGKVSIFAGQNESGKTTFLAQELGYAVNKGYPVAAYNGEMPHYEFKEWTELQMAGPWNTKGKSDEVRGKQVYTISKNKRKMIENWYSGKYWIYKKTQGVNWKDMLDTFRYATRRYGVKLFLIDNLMSAMTGATRNKSDYYFQQGQLLGQVIEFAENFEVHVILVCHPNKGIEGKLEKFDIKGNADISHRADFVFCIDRYGEDQERPEGVSPDDAGVIRLEKDRSNGQSGKRVSFEYDKKSRRIFPDEEVLERKYEWESDEERELAPF